MKKSLIFISILVAVVIMITGCPGPQSPGSDPIVFTGIIYEDGLSAVIESNLPHFNGANGFDTVDVDDPTNTEDGSNLAFNIDWTGIVAGADGWIWNGTAFVTTNSGGEDLSSYDALTFWAKIDPDTTVVNNIGFANGSDYEVYLANVAYTSTWAKYVLPLPDSTKLTGVESLFYTTSGIGGSLMLDNIQYETLGNLALTALEYTDGDISIEEGETSLTKVPTATFNDGINDITVASYDVNTGNTWMQNYLNWSSTDPNTATVDTQGNITGITAGTCTVTGSLSGVPGVVVTVGVTVSVPVAFNGPIYDDALKNGFIANSIGETTAWNGDEVAPEEFMNVFSGDSLKADLTGYSDYGGLYFEKGTGADTSAYSSNLVFYVNTTGLDASVNFVELKIEDTAGGLFSENLLIQTITASAVIDWDKVTVSVADITAAGVDLANFKGFGIWSPTSDGISEPNGGTFVPNCIFYVDNVYFE